MKRVRIVAVAIVAILAIVVFLQNTEVVETRLLMASVSMPRAVLLIVTLLIGYLLGLATASGIFRRRQQQK